MLYCDSCSHASFVLMMSSLNPYCIGCCIVILQDFVLSLSTLSLNPYCIGCCIVISMIQTMTMMNSVLILIVLDVVLWCCIISSNRSLYRVLILIVLDVVLWFFRKVPYGTGEWCLNPYCIGCCIVINLVLSECADRLSLNPYCIGCCIVIYYSGSIWLPIR